MDKRVLITELLLHDMRYQQLIDGILSAGFTNSLHGSDLGTLVAQLMEVAAYDTNDEWFETYTNFIFLASNYEITADGKNLLPLVESCYLYLSAIATKIRKKDRITDLAAC